MMKQKELESQLAEARLAKLQLEMNQEKQAFLLEKQKLLQVLFCMLSVTAHISVTQCFHLLAPLTWIFA